jgi:hypothetical protein
MSRIPPQTVYNCEAALEVCFAPVWPNQCLEGAGLQYRDMYTCRGYCNRCIMTGVSVMMGRGLADPDVFARSMGVSLSVLMRAHPEWRP